MSSTNHDRHGDDEVGYKASGEVIILEDDDYKENENTTNSTKLKSDGMRTITSSAVITWKFAFKSDPAHMCVSVDHMRCE